MLVVMLTAFADLKNAIESKKLGADDFVTAPNDADTDNDLIQDGTVVCTTTGFADPDGAGRFTTYNTGLRIFTDKTLIPNTLYAGLNISQDLTWTGPSPYQRSSTFTVSGSLAWQISQRVYLSGEVRHIARLAPVGIGSRC